MAGPVANARRLLPLVLFLGIPTGWLAGQSARLRVRVTEGGISVPGALVQVEDERRRTDGQGLAEFLLAAGIHRVVTTRIGALPDTTTVELAAGADTLLDVRLQAAPTEVEELIVFTPRSNRRIEDQPLRVEVIDTEEIEEKLLMTPGDVVMLLNETGGVRVQTTSPSLGGAGVRIQGLRGRYTQVLADGLPLFGERVGALGPLQIPPMDLGQVEVVKGVASALFGGAAVGGVINLISRRPEPGTELLLNATSLGGTDAVAFGGGELAPGARFTALAGWHRQDRTDRDRDGWSDVPGYDRLVVRPRLFLEPDPGRRLLITAGMTLETRSGGTLPGRLAPDGAPFVERLRTSRYDVGLVGRWSLSGRRWVGARAAAALQRHEHRFGSVPEPDRHRTAFAEVTFGGSAAPVDWLLGVAYTGERYRSPGLPAFAFDHHTGGLFGQVEASLTDRVAVSLSLRADHHNRYGTQVSPRISALARAGAGWTIRVSGGSGYFAPTPLVEETEATGLSRVRPPDGLRAEHAVSGSIDIGGTVGPVDLNATLFATRIASPVQVRATPAGPFAVELVNGAGPARTAGLDIIARYRRGDLFVTGSYVAVHATEPDPAGPGRRTVPLTPRHAVGLVGGIEREGRGRIGVELYLTGAQTLADNPYRSRSPAYLVVGLLVERRLGGVRLFLNFENLGNVRQTTFDPLVLPARAPDGRWTTDAWGPLDGRVVNGGIRVRF